MKCTSCGSLRYSGRSVEIAIVNAARIVPWNIMEWVRDHVVGDDCERAIEVLERYIACQRDAGTCTLLDEGAGRSMTMHVADKMTREPAPRSEK
jgi:hypothetical protein